MEGSAITVIAWDGKTLAADGRINLDGDIITDNANKIYNLDDDVRYNGDTLLAAALAGTTKEFHRVLDAIHNDDFPNNNISHKVSAIIIGENYVYELENNTTYLTQYEYDTKIAIGSGASFARSALLLGKNAVEAAKHACKLNAYCGGKIRHITFNKR